MTRSAYGSTWEMQLQHDLVQSRGERYERPLQTHLTIHTPHEADQRGIYGVSYRSKTLKAAALGWEHKNEQITQ